MTRFPKMRRFIKASAVTVPLLFFSSFLLFASRQVFWWLIPLIPAVILLVSFPRILTDASSQQTSRDALGRGWLLWVDRVAWYAIILWVITQPEIDAFLNRVFDAGGLWDWRLITAVAIVALCSIVWGLRRADQISDRAIYRYFTSSDSHKTSNKATL
jgi:hypothetical protein